MVCWTMGFIAPLTLYIGLCSYIIAHAMDFKTIVVRLDDQITLNRHTSKKKKKPSADINLMLTNILVEAFGTHLDLFKLLENTRKTVSGYLYFQFLFTLNYIAYVIFGLDGVAHELNFNGFTVYFILFISISVNFILCYYADNLTSHACGIADELYNSLWFEMPIQQQKLLLVPICRAQKLFRLTGFGIFTYSQQNFAWILLRSQFTRLIMFIMTGNKSPALMLVKDITNVNL
ncbi:uncharacterized protein LOC116340381 [Contarinia nasturtii]|uniref:uncharacterized protein LOC116340381 n=1 Tax=Contarinia nasturtii TaxID=265458 RepID=UPI0012D3E71E|nr:uncharacterized protein LOC116340381 [Contarinia nasturtii]